MNFNGKEIKTDKQGYLIRLQDWNEVIAKEIAYIEGLILSEAHWQVIYLLRDFYLEYNILPTVHILVRAMAKKYGENKGNSRYLFRLFPQGLTRQAAKIAGLPQSIICL